jgi:hypothetical protein
MNPAVDPLAALRPLHEPLPVSWWPPAPGWWMLALLVPVLIGLCIYFFRRGRTRRAALAVLEGVVRENNSEEELVRAVNSVLKRYALACYLQDEVASLTGEAWLRFLDAEGGRRCRNGFQEGAGRVLLDGGYRPGLIVDREKLCRLARLWLKSAGPRRKTRRLRS